MPATKAPPTQAPASLGEAVVAAMNKAATAPATPEVKQEVATAKVDPPAKVDVEPLKGETKPSEQVDIPLGTENPHLAPPKVEPKPAVQTDELPEKGMTKEARDWAARTRKTAEEATKRADTLTAERDDFKKKLDEAAATGPEITRLKAELNEKVKLLSALEDEISVVRVESTKPYKEAVSAPMQEVNETVDRLSKHYQLSPSAILDAIKESDPGKRAEAIEEVTAEFRALDRDDVIQAARTYARAQKLGDELRGNAKKKLEEITAASTQDGERAVAQAAKEFQSGIDDEWKALGAKYPLLRPTDSASPWNEHLDKLKREASAIDVNNVSAADVAKARAAEAALPEMARIVDSVRKQNRDLSEQLEKANARIKEYVAATPGAGAGQTTNGATKPAGTGPADIGSNVVRRAQELEAGQR